MEESFQPYQKYTWLDVSCWTGNKRQEGGQHFCFLHRFSPVNCEGLSTSHFDNKIVAAFQGMHVSPAKHSYASVTDRQTDRQTDGRTDRRMDRQTEDGQSDPYVSLCFAGYTKTRRFQFQCHKLSVSEKQYSIFVYIWRFYLTAYVIFSGMLLVWIFKS